MDDKLKESLDAMAQLLACSMKKLQADIFDVFDRNAHLTIIVTSDETEDRGEVIFMQTSEDDLTKIHGALSDAIQGAAQVLDLDEDCGDETKH